MLAASYAASEQSHHELEKARREQTDELDRHRATVLSEVAERRAVLEAEVARLEQLERDHRDRMRTYHAEQLAQLDALSHD